MRDTGDALVRGAGLSKSFGDTQAVAAVELLVRPGELVGLIGVNGAGKTTLLRMLAGISAPDAGEISLCGHAMGPEAIEAKRHLAFASDQPAVFEQFTVDEHVQLVGKIHRLEDWRERGAVLLERFGLTDRRTQLAATLSLGLKQRLALVLALLHDPSVLLLDEPLNGLDPPTRSILWEVLRERLAAGACAILSSHQLELIERLCTRILVMQSGRITWEGDASSVREAGVAGLEALLAAAGSPPPMPA